MKGAAVAIALEVLAATLIDQCMARVLWFGPLARSLLRASSPTVFDAETPAGLISVAVFVAIWVGLRRVRGGWRRRDFGLTLPRPRAAAILSVALFCAFSLCASLAALSGGFSAPRNSLEELRLQAWVLPLTAAVGEEVLFRGWVQKALARMSGARLALGVSAVLFAASHYRFGWQALVIHLPAGLAYGWLYQRTRCLPACIAVHASYDTVVLLFEYWAALDAPMFETTARLFLLGSLAGVALLYRVLWRETLALAKAVFSLRRQLPSVMARVGLFAAALVPDWLLGS